jgi:deferrochelatase/peroxidase EfeB
MHNLDADPSQHNPRLTRRAALASAGATAAVGLVAGGYQLGRETQPPTLSTIPFHGRHQAGIATPQQRHLVFAAFDLTSPTSEDLQQLLRAWTRIAEQLSRGARTGFHSAGRRLHDPGEADHLNPARLTLTFGLGPTVFELDGKDRLGLLRHKPSPLAQIPALPGDELQPERSHGDLCIQACADDPQVAFHSIHKLSLAAHGLAAPRWIQAGFLPTHQGDDHTPRNLMGFKDGTNNIRADAEASMRRHVWVGRAAEPRWMRHGSYMVTRRIRMLLDIWDGLTVSQQEEAVGRHKSTGAPLGMRSETDPVDLSAKRDGAPAIPVDAHIRLAAHSQNGARILRRGYSYNDGVDPATGQIDAGLFFICFQRDPGRQFAAIQGRLGVDDALAKHLSHTSSAVFACPPGVRPGGYVGERLFAPA